MKAYDDEWRLMFEGWVRDWRRDKSDLDELAPLIELAVPKAEPIDYDGPYRFAVCATCRAIVSPSAFEGDEHAGCGGLLHPAKMSVAVLAEAIGKRGLELRHGDATPSAAWSERYHKASFIARAAQQFMSDLALASPAEPPTLDAYKEAWRRARELWEAKPEGV